MMLHAYYLPRRDLFVFTGSVGNSRRSMLEAFLRARWSAQAYRVSKEFPLPYDGLSAWRRPDGVMVLRLLAPMWNGETWVSTHRDLDVPPELASMLREAAMWESLNDMGTCPA